MDVEGDGGLSEKPFSKSTKSSKELQLCHAQYHELSIRSSLVEK